MENKISIIGIGKLGLCFGLNLSKAGWDVIGMDANEDYVNQLQNNTFKSTEEGVNDYLNECGFNYTSKIDDALSNDIIFVVVPTPSTHDFKYDHKYIENVVEEIISKGPSKNRKDLIINCTTFPKYCEELQDRLIDYNYFVSYNPEFIAQGTIIKDQLYCDNVLIGEADEFAGDLIQNIYKSFVKSDPIYNRMSRTEAEITKLSVNCFLTTKISFANMVGDIASRCNADPDVVLKAVGTDSRIGSKYIRPGFGFGGPCFPRDNRALAKLGEEVGIKALISEATDKMNKLHLNYQVEDFVNKSSIDEIVDIDYVTYKKESVSIEESQQLKFAIELQKRGYKINIKDNRQEVLNQIKNVIQ